MTGDGDLKTWLAPRWSMSTVFFGMFAVAGPVVFVLGIRLLVSPPADTPSPTSGGAFFLIVGSVMVVQGLFFILAPARRVTLRADGQVTFVSRGRTVEVGAGQLISLRSIWPDPNRMLPMLVTARNGRILLAPRFPDANELVRALAKWNPDARITHPWPRRWRADEWNVPPPSERPPWDRPGLM